MQRDNGWEENSHYSEEQVEAVLGELGIEVVGDTWTHFQALCPFHGNTYTPAFVVDKEKGLFHCNNPSCGLSGTLIALVKRMTERSDYEALRFIAKHKSAKGSDLSKELDAILAKEELPEFSQTALDKMKSQFPGSKAESYMRSRHFEDGTLDYFDIGYSSVKDMVTVPMHDEGGRPIGIIGRSLEGKVFKNSRGLPKSKTAWNIHRAKQEDGPVVICEASFDAMRIWQAGHRNVVALLGGTFNKLHAIQLGKHFNSFIIMSDLDDKHFYPNCRRCGGRCRGHRPGRDLGNQIEKEMRGKEVRWASLSNNEIFPLEPLEGYRDNHAKDAGNMTDEEIMQCITNAKSPYEYYELALSLDAA